MIALYLAAGVAALLAYGGMGGLTFSLLEWGWPAQSSSDREGMGFASIIWPLTLPVAGGVAAAIWVACRVAVWRDAKRLPRAQVFRG